MEDSSERLTIQTKEWKEAIKQGDVAKNEFEEVKTMFWEETLQYVYNIIFYPNFQKKNLFKTQFFNINFS